MILLHLGLVHIKAGLAEVKGRQGTIQLYASTIHTLYIQRYKYAESRRTEKDTYHANSYKKKAGVAILISEENRLQNKKYHQI